MGAVCHCYTSSRALSVNSTDMSCFEFVQVLPSAALQTEVYEAAASDIVDDVLNGFNGTIMAYGQVCSSLVMTQSTCSEGAL